MKWNNSFAIGIGTIDDQHRKIFEHLLAIENAVAKRDPWHIQRFLLSQLSDYLKFHLAVEESLLEVVGYPGRAGHGEAHAGLMEQVGELERGIKDNPSGENLVRFFESWFLKHVLESDREYVSYIEREVPVFKHSRPL